MRRRSECVPLRRRRFTSVMSRSTWRITLTSSDFHDSFSSLIFPLMLQVFLFCFGGLAAGFQVLVSRQLMLFVWQSATRVHRLVYWGSPSCRSSFPPSAPHTLHLSHYYHPLPPLILLLILLISLPVLSSFSFCPSSPSLSFPCHHLPPPLPPPVPLAKVHVINQTKLWLCLRLQWWKVTFKVHLLKYSLKGHYLQYMVACTSASLRFRGKLISHTIHAMC